MTDPCNRCQKEIPIRGPICEWCVFDEHCRIKKLPVPEQVAALKALDIEIYGFVKSNKDRISDVEIAFGVLKKKMDDLKISVEDLDE